MPCRNLIIYESFILSPPSIFGFLLHGGLFVSLDLLKNHLSEPGNSSKKTQSQNNGLALLERVDHDLEIWCEKATCSIKIRSYDHDFEKLS